MRKDSLSVLMAGVARPCEILARMIPNWQIEVLEPVFCKEVPSENDFEALDRFG